MRKALAIRRRINQALAQQDAAHRCAECRLNLAEVETIVEDFLTAEKFCSEACHDQRRDRRVSA